MATVHFVTHPEVVIDPLIPVPDWPLSALGRARMAALARDPMMRGLAAVWSSAERKARDGAEILAEALGLEPRICEGLHENDRSATGFLPPPEFEATADLFFAHPTTSIRGWKTAAAAQARVLAAIEEVLSQSPPGDVGIVAHGGVGTLLLCHLEGVPITRALDQKGAGHRLAFDRASRVLRHGWTALPREPSPS